MAKSELQLNTKVFRKGTLIMIEGKLDKFPQFNIILEGRVQLYREVELIEDEEDEAVLEEGDFFGVISCMSGHPSVETAKAVTDCKLIVVPKNLFGPLIQKNVAVGVKIVRYFSKKLRHSDEILAKHTFQKKNAESDPSQLFDVAQYYDAQKQYNLALYAYVRYVQYFENGEHVDEAKNKIAQLSPLAKDAMNPQNSGEGLTRSFKDGTFICCEHEKGEELYIIQKGKIKVTKVMENNEKMLAVIGTGEIFGEMAILENKPRTASGIAFGESGEDVICLAVNKNNFESMIMSQPQLATNLIQRLGERIWTIYRQMDTILLKEPVARLYDVLLSELQKQKIDVENRKDSYTFSFGPKELISMAGFTQDEGKKVVKELLENKKIKLVDGNFFVEKMNELQKQVQFYKGKQERDRKLEAQKKRR